MSHIELIQPKLNADAAQKDVQSVTPSGAPVTPTILGVAVRPAITHLDERGEICEVYSPAWDFHDAPLVYVYRATVRPGEVKGWVVHRKQDDRLFFAEGIGKLVLYDDRSESVTHGMVNEFFFGENRRALVTVPAGVYHAVANVGTHSDVVFVNMPTRAYDHQDPDKYRLPLENSLIPYSWERTR